MFGPKPNPDLEKFAKLLEEAIASLFMERGQIKFSQPPETKKRDILEYQGRMRADGLEKFNGPTYVSTLNYFLSTSDMQKQKAIGGFVFYVEQSYMAPLMKKLKYPNVDDENEEALKDGCGTVCNLIGGKFKSNISSAGYRDLEMSHFTTYRNSASNGVAFCFSEYEKCEISFFIDGEKRVVADLTIGNVPKK